jgi:hypothetical protein
MQDEWEISGEIGAGMGPARLNLAALYPLVQPLVFRSQAADSFGYFLPIEVDGSNSHYVPDRGQSISLWREGVREFTGRVVTRKYIYNGTGQGWQIEANGGWHELERLPLLAGENATYDLPQQNIRDSILAILNFAMESGARFQIGDVAEMMDCFPLQFRAATMANTLSDLLRFAQDAMTYFDYNGTGLPTLHITRRPTAAVREFTLGRDAITQCELSPDDAAAADRVDFIYALADANGIVTQQTQSAGVEIPRNRLTVVTAETGFEDFTAKATAAQQTLLTSASLTWAGYLNTNAELAAYVTANSVPDFSVGPGSYNDQNSPSTPNSFFSVAFPATTFQTTEVITGKEVVAKGQWRDWMEKLGFSAAKATASACFYNTGIGLNLPAWVANLPVSFFSHQGYASGNSTGKWAVWFYVQQAVDMISPKFAADTIVRDPGNYPLVAPPDGIAAFLSVAMAEAPYDGRIVADGYYGYVRTLGRVVNVLGGAEELASCRALTREESHDLQTGSWTLTTGQSAAGRGLELLSRFRRLSAT